MPSESAIRAGQAFIEIFADDGLLRSQLTRIAARFQSWGRSFNNIGGTLFWAAQKLASPLIKGLRDELDNGATLALLSQRTGVSVEMLSALRFGAQQSHIPVAQLELALRRLSRTLNGAGAESKKNVADLAKVGLSLSDLKGLTPDQQLRKIADGLASIHDKGTQIAVATELLGQFGRGGTEMLNIFAGGSATFDKFAEEAKKLGLIVPSKEAFDALRLQRNWEALGTTLNRVRQIFASALLPYLIQITNALLLAEQRLIPWVEQNKQLAIIVAVVAAGLAALGVAFYFIGGVLTGIGAAFAILGTVMGLLGGVILFILSPIGLLIAALGFLGVALNHFLHFAGAARSYLFGVWNGIKTDALVAFGGIKNALIAGDWSLAAQIMWTLIKLEFTKGIGTLKLLWVDFKSFLLGVFYEATYKLQSYWSEFSSYMLINWPKTTAAIRIGWADAVLGMRVAWANFVYSIKSTWEEVQHLLSKQFLKFQGLDAGQLAQAEADEDKQHGQNQASIDSDHNSAIAKAETDRDNAVAKAEADSKKSKEQLQREHDNEEERLRQQLFAERRALAKANGAVEEKALEDKIAALRKQLGDLDKKAQNEKNQAPTVGPVPGDEAAPNDFGKQLDDIGKATGGFFNSGGAFGIGGDTDPAKNTEKHTKETADNTAKLLAHFKGSRGARF